MKKIIFRILGILAIIWSALFAVFFFDLDGKFMYYIWEPMMINHFDRMKRKDNTKTPYDIKENI